MVENIITVTNGNLIFDDKEHKYYVDGKELISVTTLLAKHGITESFDNIPDEVKGLIQYKAERGTIIHSEIEEFVKNGIVGFSAECQYFAEHIYPLCDVWLSEVQLYCENYAGTCDLIGIKDNTVYIIDTKTGTVHKDAVAWQTTLYRRCIELKEGLEVKYFCYDAKSEAEKCQLIELQPIPEVEVQKLLMAEMNGEIYRPTQLKLSETQEIRIAHVETEIALLEKQVKELKTIREELQADLIQAFEQYGVKEFDGGAIHITYVAPTTRKTVDSAKLKADYKDIYEECLKESPVKASVRIKVKGVA